MIPLIAQEAFKFTSGSRASVIRLPVRLLPFDSPDVKKTKPGDTKLKLQPGYSPWNTGWPKNAAVYVPQSDFDLGLNASVGAHTSRVS
jgi:hypothetical protein